MPLLFLLLSVGAVLAMGAAKAVSKSPPINESPPQMVLLQPSEVWGISGTIMYDMTGEQWETFHTQLTTLMDRMHGRIGKLLHDGRTFAFQVQPISHPIHLQVPMVDPFFRIDRATKLTATTVSGCRRWS
jgi:hypothetical protein